MDLNALNHEYHKIMVDANVATVRNTDTDIGSPPPAYTPQDQTPPRSTYDDTLDDDEDDDDDDLDEEDDLYADPDLAHSINGALSRSSTPESTQDDTSDGEKTIHMNNKLSVLGSQNIITASPLDGMRWTASILAILNGNRPLPCQEHQHQHRRAGPATTDNQPTDAQSILSPQARGPVNILIDCSVHVVGDRNIVGGNPAAAAYGALAAARGDNAGTAAQTQTQTTNGMPHAAPAPAPAPNATLNGTESDKPAPPAAPLTPPAAADSAASALPRPSLAGAASVRHINNNNNNNPQPTHANGARKRLCVSSAVPAASASTATVDERAARATSFVDANAVAAQLGDAGVCGGLGREGGGMGSITRKRAREEEDDGDA